jgi:4-amino-4-deoxy-L-arabinose transferase-like glycosyltransferase
MAEQIQKNSIPRSKQGILEALSTFLSRNEFLIPLSLFLLFLAFTLPGIAWGAPSGWHPDEIVVRSIKALHGEWQFSETNFDYPDLPQYTMYWLGKMVLAVGYGDGEVLIASRILSAMLAGLTVVLTYKIARLAGASISTAGLAGLFLVCITELAHNGHFAHNDTYVIFFTTLSLLLLLQYHRHGHRGWLYVTFLTVGMAASSKYIGGSFIIAPVTYYLFTHRKDLRTNLFSVAETIFISGALTFLGYAIGTPKALFWMTFYFKRVLTALQWQVNYGNQPGNVRGFIGQYQTLWTGLGWVIFLLFAAGFLWACYRVFQSARDKTIQHDPQMSAFAILLLAVFVLDLPMLVSYNYQFRYFLSILPILAIFSAFLVEAIHTQATQRNRAYSSLVLATVALIVVYSFARLISMALLFMNDARTPAGQFIASLPAGTSLEATFYTPDVPAEHFEREHNYPIYFIRSITDEVPAGKNYDFNAGEAGLDERQTTYLVIDSFIADHFDDPYTCSMMPVECEFFQQLATGASNHYKLIAEFAYQLPAFLPQIQVEYVNPSIRVYERIP